jgi:hypothetical protein
LTKPQSWQFVSAENGLSALLYFTLAYLLVVCIFGDFSFGGLVGRVLFSLIIIAGVAATFKQRWVRFFIIVLAVSGLILTWLEHIHPAWTLSILNALLGMIFLLFLFATLIVQVFQRGVVTGHKIRGAVVVYMIIGAMWSLFYYVVALANPQAFNWPNGLITADRQAVQQVLTYFSFITLTTIGYGDVTPVIPLTRTLAMFEGLAGQLYLVVTLTRLVSLSVVCPNLSDKED